MNVGEMISPRLKNLRKKNTGRIVLEFFFIPGFGVEGGAGFV